MKRQISAGIGIVLLVLLPIAGIKFFQISRAIAEHANFAPPPEAVTSSRVEEQVWPRVIEVIGEFAPINGVMLSAEESGKVTKIRFESGALVAAGDVLVELDTSVEEASLRGALARADLARQTLARQQSLKSGNVNSAADVDTASASFRQADAEVEGLRATIARKRIIAPFAGRTGIRMINIGQYVDKGTKIVPLQSLDPIYVNFSVPQRHISDLKSGLVIETLVDAFPDRKFVGTITAVNPEVSEATRNVEVQGTIPNAKEEIRPGMFARVRVLLSESDKQLAIPTSGVSYAPYGNTVFVIEKMKNQAGKEILGVRQQVVTLGERRGDLVAVRSGLKVGDEVVSSGVFKLRPGAEVKVDNSFKPGQSLEPYPADT